jgi:hypothetical protein
MAVSCTPVDGPFLGPPASAELALDDVHPTRQSTLAWLKSPLAEASSSGGSQRPVMYQDIRIVLQVGTFVNGVMTMKQALNLGDSGP